MDPCGTCGGPAALRCGRCLGAVYCGVPCQRAAYGSHKAACRAAASATRGQSAADVDAMVTSLRAGAAANDPVALFMLGGTHVNAGIGTVKSAVEGAALIARAADLGLATALLALGQHHYDAARYSDALALLVRAAEPTRPRQALRWYVNLVLNEETPEAAAQYLLGECYTFGRGVAVDKKRAVELWKRAASKGDDDAAQALLHGRGM